MCNIKHIPIRSDLEVFTDYNGERNVKISRREGNSNMTVF